MSAQASAFVVTLANDISGEDVERVAEMLGLLRGVVDVQPVTGPVTMEFVGQTRADSDWQRDLFDLIKRRMGS